MTARLTDRLGFDSTVEVIAEPGAIRVGPVLAGRDACPECLRYRRCRASLAADGPPATEPGGEGSLLTSTARAVAAELVATAGDRVGDGQPTYWLLDLTTLEVTEHRYLPDPQCARCGGLEPDRPEDPGLGARPLTKPDRGRHRLRDLGSELAELERTYVDPDAGIVRSLNPSTIGRTVVAGAPVRLRGLREFEPGFGRSTSHPGSRLTALLEALERYAASRPGRRRTVVRGSWRELHDVALDPAALGLPHATGPGTPYRRYTPDAETSWVWGWSATDGRPRLVPEEVAYFALEPDPARSPFCDDVGSGVALGSCLEEAALHAVWEVVERDGFLRTWLTRTPAPELRLTDLDHPALAVQACAVTVDTGFVVRLFDTTMEHGLPSIWAIATNPDPAGEPTLICAGGAGATRAEAAHRAVVELGPMVHVVREHFELHAAEAEAMARDPKLVRSMMHHYLVNASRASGGRLDFLLDQEPTPPRPDPEGLAHADLRDDLARVVEMLRDVGLELVVVDQTPPELAASGLSCARVVVPGLVPLTFGHHRSRVVGLERVPRTPQLLGLASGPLADEELNGDPHPFP